MTWQRLLTWAVAVAAVVVATFFVSESDLFMHLRNGERMLESGRLEKAEVYSYTSTEAEFPNHEWLSNLLGALLWRVGGFDLLVAAKAVAAGLLILVLAGSARARGARGFALPLALLVGLVLVRFRLYTRPEIFTLVFLPLVDLLCLRSIAAPERRQIWLVPVLCVVWANLHPGVILAPIVVATHGIGALLSNRLPVLESRGRPRDGRRLILVAVACLPAMVMTPYGAGIFKPLVRISTSDAIRSAAVREWLPPTVDDFSFFFVVLGAGTLLILAGSRRVAVADLALWVGFATLALRSLRHVGVFAVMATPVLALAASVASEWMGRMAARYTPNLRWVMRPWVRAVGVGALIVAATLGLLSPKASILHQDQSRHYRFGLGLDNLSAPISSVDLLEQWEVPGPLYNTWDFGGYLIWRSWPRLQVFLDGRDYMYTDVIEELVTVPFHRVLETRGVRTMLVSHEDEMALDVAIKSPGMVLLVFDDRAQLWTRVEEVASRPGLTALDHLQPHDLSLQWFDRLTPEARSDAVRAAQQAVERAPEHARPWALLGLVQRRIGDYEKAVESYERAVALDVGQASYVNNLGICLLDLGRADEAEKFFRRATRLAPSLYSAHFNLGRARLLLGDPGGATTALMRALDTAPERPEPHYLLGIAAADPGVAREHFKRYLEMAPDGPWAAEARARIPSL